VALAFALALLLKIVYTTTMQTTTSGKMEYQRDEHRVHLIVYHLIWCPKRRKAILTDQIKERLIELLKHKCKEKGWDIRELAVQPDHVHLFVRVWPTESAADVVKELKGVTSFHLRKEFSTVLSKLPSLWTRSYFASTSGNVSAETIQRYIEAQKGI
jgi:putative transposase